MIIIIACIIAAALLVVFNRLYRKKWSDELSVDLKFDYANVYEKDKLILVEKIKNSKLLPVPILEVDFNLSKNFRFINSENNLVSDKLYRRDVFSIGSRQQITRRLEVTALRRGVYSIDSAGVTSQDFFLRKKMGRQWKQDSTLTVYPQRISTRRLNNLYRVLNGELSSAKNRLEDPFEFNGIREYITGDSLKSVNWKASAKTGSMMVNKYSSTSKNKLIIILDYSDSSSSDDYDLNEECIRLAASLSERFLVSSVELHFMSNTYDVISGEAVSNIEVKSKSVFLSQLARIEEKDDHKFTGRADESSESAYYLLITKNYDSSPAFNIFSGDESSITAIIPYKNEKPAIRNAFLAGKKVIFWEYYEGSR